MFKLEGKLGLFYTSVYKLSVCGFFMFYVTCKRRNLCLYWSLVLLISTNDLSRRMQKIHNGCDLFAFLYFLWRYHEIADKASRMKKFINGIVLRDSIRLLFRHSNNCKFIQAGEQDARNIIWLFRVGFNDFESAANSMSIKLWIRSSGIMMETVGINETSPEARISDLTRVKKKTFSAKPAPKLFS